MTWNWIPKELESAGVFTTRAIEKVEDFDSLLNVEISRGTPEGQERVWLIRRLLNGPQSIPGLIPAGRRVFGAMTREKLFQILTGLYKDGYRFCKLANVAGKKNVRSFLLILRGDENDPWGNCGRCPAIEKCPLEHDKK